MSAETDLRHASLTQFLEYIDRKKMFWIVKRLSGNDTGLTGGHQVGVYYPRSFFEYFFPEILSSRSKNPKTSIVNCYFPNADEVIHDITVTWYNNKYFGGTRDEFRITKWGGTRSPTNDLENTGGIFVFALFRAGDEASAVGWVASSLEEENLIEAWLSEEVEPGEFYMPIRQRRIETRFLFPEKWLEAFPTGKEIFDLILQQLPRANWHSSIDKLLLKRRQIEFDLYRTLENKIALPRILEGFSTVDDFIKYALSVSNRRKSRTGKSLELNLEAIFQDEKLYFEAQTETEHSKRPDFLFPSGKAYRNPTFPNTHLQLVAAKTTTKDRWRQVIDEAERIHTKHLFTLQQGISPRQLHQIETSHIQLVVPEPYLKAYPEEWRTKILTLKQLTDTIRTNQSTIKNIEQWTA